MSTGSSVLFTEDRRKLRTKSLIIGGILAVATLLSLCTDPNMAAFNSPLEVLGCYALWLQQLFASFSQGEVLSSAEVMALHEPYYRVMAQAGTTVVTLVCGGLLALAGSLYQNVFRNPIASPTMLGVTGGVRLGVAVLVMMFGVAAGSMIGWHYLICYIVVIIMLILLFVFSKLMTGKGRPINIVNMLLVGTLLNQFSGVFLSYITWNSFDSEMWLVYQSIVEALRVDTSPLSFAILLATCIVAVVPVILMRFRLNALSYGADDMRMLGVNSHRMQIITLIAGTLMIMTAQIQVGAVAMASLVVPHLSRAMFGAEFGKHLVGNVLLGAALLIVCRCVVGFIPFVGYGLPMSTVVDFVAMPAFIWILALQQKGWK